MANPQAQKSASSTHNGIIAILLPCLLIGSFLWKVLVPAHEYAMRADQVMTMSLDALMLAGLFGIRRSIPQPLFWCALVAGIGLFALRMNGTAGWWTGHLVYSIPRR
jgi:hypothetical protein